MVEPKPVRRNEFALDALLLEGEPFVGGCLVGVHRRSQGAVCSTTKDSDLGMRRSRRMEPDMNRDEIESVERDEVSRKDLEDALKQVLLLPAESRPRSENREPTRDELATRYRLDRRGNRKPSKG